MSERWCPGCKANKPAAEFARDRSRKSGVQSYCKPCANARSLKWANANRDTKRKCDRRWWDDNQDAVAAKRLKTYGLTPEQYREMEAACGGNCMICHKRPTRRGDRRLCIDHDHGTGRVRGILCHRCNSALGLLDERVDFLAAAIAYLDQHKPRAVA